MELTPEGKAQALSFIADQKLKLQAWKSMSAEWERDSALGRIYLTAQYASVQERDRIWKLIEEANKIT